MRHMHSITQKTKCSDASSCTCIMVCHINMILFFSVIAPFPPFREIVSMTQASFPPFQIPQENSILYGNIPDTPNITRDHVSMPGSGSQDNTSLLGNLGSISSVSSDSSLLSSAPILLYQLVRQYRYCQEELKRTKHEHE